MKNAPKITLVDLLRKRKLTLKNFLLSHGLHAYQALLDTCNSMGVKPPLESEFNEAFPQKVTSQQDGIVVIEPQVVIEHIDLQETPIESLQTIDTSGKQKQKKSKKQDE